jgi:hypothetical protein
MYRRPDSEALIMKARELIDTAEVPGGEPLRLFRRGDDFMIVLDRNELMNSRMSGLGRGAGGDDARAARLGLSPHVLIGGYGMGFTLRAALARCRRAGGIDGGRAGAHDHRMGEGADGGADRGLPRRSGA